MLITLSVIDLEGEKTNISYSVREGKTLLPSWTLCPWEKSEYSIPINQTYERMGNGSQIPFNLTIHWHLKEITNPEVLKNEFHELFL